jgi:hypothetical protein
MALFAFEQKTPDGEVVEFIFELVDSEKIKKARAILEATNPTKNRVSGTVVAGRKSYNPDWSFHLDPESIGFFEMAMEVCDANVSYVEAHLSEVGGDFLPNGYWCPWSSKLKRELGDCEKEV